MEIFAPAVYTGGLPAYTETRMKRGKSRRKPLPGKPNQKPAPVTDRRLIPVNDLPLRKRAAMKFKQAMAKLEKARAELQRFEQEDRPSFGRWMIGRGPGIRLQRNPTNSRSHQ